MYKALITDLDGTAVPISSDGREINERTKQAIKKAQQKGFKITCASGRQWKLVKPVIKKLGFTSPCIVEGGTRIVDPLTGKTIWEKDFEKDIATAIFTILKTESKDGLLMTSADKTYRPIHTINFIPDKLCFIYLLGIDKSLASSIAEKVNALENVAAHLTLSWEGQEFLDIHVTPLNATKEFAIKKWLEIESIKKEEVIGMGDSGNDIPIFQYVVLKVAVQNATPEILKLADYIAPSVTDDGLAHVIEKYFFST